MLDEHTAYPGSFQQLADARRALKVLTSLDKHPVLPADERLALRQVKALAIRCIGAAVEELVETLDILDGDTDAEDATDAEDEGLSTLAKASCDCFPGCPASDPGGGNAEDEGEPEEGY